MRLTKREAKSDAPSPTTPPHTPGPHPSPPSLLQPAHHPQPPIARPPEASPTPSNQLPRAGGAPERLKPPIPTNEALCPWPRATDQKSTALQSPMNSAISRPQPPRQPFPLFPQERQQAKPVQASTPALPRGHCPVATTTELRQPANVAPTQVHAQPSAEPIPRQPPTRPDHSPQ